MSTSEIHDHFHEPEAAPVQIGTARALDRLGASLSFACAIHCALQPLLLALLPLIGLGFLLDERLESIFLACSILLASATVISGWRHHRQPQALPLLGAAVVLIIASRLPGLAFAEVPLAVSGALGIMSAHLYNLRLHRRMHGEHRHADHAQAHVACEAPLLETEPSLELASVVEAA